MVVVATADDQHVVLRVEVGRADVGVRRLLGGPVLGAAEASFDIFRPMRYVRIAICRLWIARLRLIGE